MDGHRFICDFLRCQWIVWLLFSFGKDFDVSSLRKDLIRWPVN